MMNFLTQISVPLTSNVLWTFDIVLKIFLATSVADFTKLIEFIKRSSHVEGTNQISISNFLNQLMHSFPFF